MRSLKQKGDIANTKILWNPWSITKSPLFTQMLKLTDHLWLKKKWFGKPISSVGRAGVLRAEALSSLPPLPSCLLSWSCPINNAIQRPKKKKMFNSIQMKSWLAVTDFWTTKAYTCRMSINFWLFTCKHSDSIIWINCCHFQSYLWTLS